MAWTCGCVAMLGGIQVGLDVEMTLPGDSYLLNYFTKLTSTIRTGPTVQFVVEDGFDYSTLENQNMICGGPGCDEDSLLGQIFQASEQPEE